jgi:ribonucleoside-triphosphate reductase
MAIYKVRKRNGSIVTFEREKIEKAIEKAIKSVGGEDFTKVKAMTNEVVSLLKERVGNDIPEIEQIQDIVEEVLIKNEHNEVAKAYILYRQKRAESRENKDIVVEVEKTMDEYLQNIDWRIKENANIGYSIG